VRIVDLSQHLAGPFCTMLLADMGAEVIKLEPPWGDASRASSQYPRLMGQSTYFMFPNRNKKSVVLNLRLDKGVKILRELVRISDVLVENFRPGVMERLGLGYDALSRENPGLIYASISGFGQYGPYVKRPSYDIISQAMSGWMWLNSREVRGLNSKPSFVPVCLAGSPGDTIPGTFCALGILAALHSRKVTGRGQRIDVAQTDSLMTISGLALTRYLFLKTPADDKARQTSTAIHGVYEADDGYIVLRATDETDLSTLAEVVGVEPEELGSNSGILIDWVRGKTRREISDLLAEKVPCAPVLTDEELVEDPNVKERAMIVEKPHPLGFTYRSVATGIKFSETPVSVDAFPPDLGEQTEQVLSLLGYGEREMDLLEEEKVIARKRVGRKESG